MQSEDQIVKVMGQYTHLVSKLGSARLAKSNLIQGLIQSVMIGIGGNIEAAQIANFIGNMTSLKYGNDMELESDEVSVRVMMEAVYNPEHMAVVMDILEESSGGHNGTDCPPSNPHPVNRK